jgi:hypothetical protein
VVAGFAPSPLQRLSATIVPSLCRQVTLRVMVALVEQELLGAPKAPTFHVSVQALVSEKVWLKASSVPQLKPLVGVHASEVAGAELVQLAPSTVVPSERTQETDCAAVPEFAVTLQVPVRVCVKLVPQPVAGRNGVYEKVPVPPVQLPKPLPTQLKVQPLKSEATWLVSGLLPAVAQLSSLTVVPSERRQETLRVSVELAEQVLLELNAPTLQLKEQVLKSLKDSKSAPSVPQENPEAGVQDCKVAGGALVQFASSTVVPSLRWQEMVWV